MVDEIGCGGRRICRVGVVVGEVRSVIDDESWGELGDVVDWLVRGKGSEGEREREREGGRSV